MYIYFEEDPIAEQKVSSANAICLAPIGGDAHKIPHRLNIAADQELLTNGHENNLEFVNHDEAGSVDADSFDEVGEVANSGEKIKKARRAPGIIIAITVIAVTFFFGYRLFSQSKPDEQSAAPTEKNETQISGFKLTPEQAEKITTEIVQRRTVQDEVKSPGKVAFNSSHMSPVLAQFSGRLTKLNAEIGDHVQAGQILGMIETPDTIAPQADFQQALGSLRTAQTSLETTRRIRERSDRLAKAEAIPLRELQQAQTDETHATEDVQKAEQAISSARAKLQAIGFKETEIGGLSNGDKVLNRPVPITAPISGTIIERKAGLGQIVQPGGDALYQIANLSTLWVNAEVYEDQLSRLRVGAPANIEAPAYPAEKISARVDQIGSIVDADKRTVAVRCIVPNASGKLKPGMFVNISLGGISNLEAISVPATAIVTEGERRIVFVETEMGRYEKREVTAGGEHDGNVIVKSGLKDGEKVVTKGSLLISSENGS